MPATEAAVEPEFFRVHSRSAIEAAYPVISRRALCIASPSTFSDRRVKLASKMPLPVKTVVRRWIVPYIS